MLFEPAFSDQCYRLLWTTSNANVSVFGKRMKGGTHLTIIQGNEEDVEPEVELYANMMNLVECLLRLCFWPGFTV